MTRFARWLAEKPWIILAGATALTLGLGWFALKIRIHSDFESVLPVGDPAIAYYEQVRATFGGGDDVGVVGLLSDDLFTPAVLEKVNRVSLALAKLEGVATVFSLTNSKDLAANFTSPPKFLPRMPPAPEDIAELKQKLTDVPFYRRNLVSDDFKGTAITIFFKPISDDQYAAVDQRIDEILA